jgi:hypothetical protein
MRNKSSVSSLEKNKVLETRVTSRFSISLHLKSPHLTHLETNFSNNTFAKINSLFFSCTVIIVSYDKCL